MHLLIIINNCDLIKLFKLAYPSLIIRHLKNPLFYCFYNFFYELGLREQSNEIEGTQS